MKEKDENQIENVQVKYFKNRDVSISEHAGRPHTVLLFGWPQGCIARFFRSGRTAVQISSPREDAADKPASLTSERSTRAC